MILPWLEGLAWSEPQIHLGVLAALGAGSSLLLLSVLLSFFSRGDGGLLTRLWGAMVVLLGTVGVQAASEVVSHGGVDVAAVSWGVWSLSLVVLVVLSTVASARTGFVVVAAHGMTCCGWMVYLALVRAVPEAGDPTWEMGRMADVALFNGVGGAVLLCSAFLGVWRRGWWVRGLYLLAGLFLLFSMATVAEDHPRASLTSVVLVLLVALLGAGWLLLYWPARGKRSVALGLLLLQRAWGRLLRSRVFGGMLVAAPVFLAMLGWLLGGDADARDAARITLLGIDATPNLWVPLFFALAIGYLLGRDLGRYQVWWVLALTLLVLVFMLSQKEVGNSAVLVVTLAVALLVARGTVLHLGVAGLVGLAGVALAYYLAPIFDVVPYTFYERIHLWLGGAELMHRGGSLVASSHISYDVGGFWGIGIHRSPGLDLHRLMVALDTDFPLTVLGLSGGLPLLLAFVLYLTSLALMGLQIVRRMGYGGNKRRARRAAPLLAALWAVPVVSTLVNLFGAVLQAMPFTGIPVAFVSYSLSFTVGNFFVLSVFLFLGNADAARRRVKATLERREGLAGLSAFGAVPGAAARRLQEVEGEKVVRRWRWRWGWHGLNLLLWRWRRRARFRSVEGGLRVLVLLVLGAAVVAGLRLWERYTDNAVYFSHPRLHRVVQVEVLQEEDGPLRWVVREGPGEVLGVLEEGQRLVVDELLLRFRRGALEVLGGCYDEARFGQGISLGYAGMLDAPELPWVGRWVEGELSRRWGRRLRNDIVIPEGSIAMHHAVVRRHDGGRFVVDAVRSDFDVTLLDGAGEEKFSGERLMGQLRTLDWVGITEATTIGEGESFVIGEPMPLRFSLERSASGALCLVGQRPLQRYVLSTIGPTVLGGSDVRRRRLGGVTQDQEFVEAFKVAAEAGLLWVGETGGLETIPFDEGARRSWDARRRTQFSRVFTVIRQQGRDGGMVETLAWSRPFYRDGTRAFRPRRELDAFVVRGRRVLGLAEPERFSRVLPTGRAALDPERYGSLLDRQGRGLSRVAAGVLRVDAHLVGGGALLGYNFEGEATRDGLLRIFSSLMRGTEEAVDPRRELAELLVGEWRAAWGWDVVLTLDAAVQGVTYEVMADEVRKLKRRAPHDAHHASAVVLGPGNRVVAVVQFPDTGDLTRLAEVTEWKRLQQAMPMRAPALDAFHRRTTMGSTVKVLSMIAAFRHAEGVLFEENGEWYIDARGDSGNGLRGRFMDRGGTLSTWRGRRIVPISNFENKAFGRVISLREMIVQSVNTAASYMGANLGRARYEELYAVTGMNTAQDLLSPDLGPDGAWGHFIERYPRDAATGLGAAVAVLPEGERWTVSYTARLPLSGNSDFSVLNLAAGTSIVARHGRYVAPRLVEGMRHRKTGQWVGFAEPEVLQVISEEHAALATSYMRDVLRRGTAQSFRREAALEIWRETAGKTGTGETVVPVDPNASYDRLNKPKTRDNKVFVAFWPTSSPDPYVVAVLFEQSSHLDGRVAVRATRRIIEGLAGLELADPFAVIGSTIGGGVAWRETAEGAKP